MPETATLDASAAATSVVADGAASHPASIASPTDGQEPRSQDTAQPGADGQEPVTGADGVQESVAGEDEGDGRSLPKSIRALKETDPAAYKAEKTRFFRGQAFDKEFPGGVTEARQLKQSLDLVGGREGLVKLQTDMADFKNVAKQYFDGSPEFVDGLAKEDPIAFGTHVPLFLNRLKDVDPEGFNRLVAQQIHTEHQAIGLRSDLERVYAAIKGGQTNDALQILNDIAVWHDKITNLAKQEEDPKYKRLQEQIRTERESQRQQTLQNLDQQYKTEAKKHLDSFTNSLIDSYTKGRKLEEADRKRLFNAILREADDEVNGDEAFKRQRNLLFKEAADSGDVSASIRLANSRYEQAIREAARGVIGTFSKGATPVSRADKTPPTNGQKPPGNDGFTPVNVRPAAHLIDRSKTTTRMILHEKRAILKDGSKQSWAHLQ